MKKNILILLPASYGGGAENEVLDYVKNYDIKKFNLFVITFKKGNIEHEFIKTCNKHKANYKCLGSRFFFSLSAFINLKRFIKKNKIDIIHANLFQTELYTFLLSLLNKKYSTIATKHAIDPFKHLLLFRLIENILSSRNMKTIVVSKALYGFYNKKIGVRKENLQIIPNGIDTREFEKKYPNEKINDIRKKIGLKEWDFVVGIVSRIEKGKNHLNLIKAVQRLNNEIKNIKLIIIGEGSLRKNIESYIKKNHLNKFIKILGYKDKIYDYYHVMDVFCLPSDAEGFGRVNAEAILSGAFVITSNNTAMREVIRNNKDGFLIDPENIDEIAEKILWVYNNRSRAKDYIKNGKENIREKFDLDLIIKLKERLYDILLKNG